VILDQNGAESLLGQGDTAVSSPVGSSKLQRIQGAYIDEAQIAKLLALLGASGQPELREELLEEVERRGRQGRQGRRRVRSPDEDPLPATRSRSSRDGHGLDLDAPARLAAGLHPRRSPDRHARAPRT